MTSMTKQQEEPMLTQDQLVERIRTKVTQWATNARKNAALDGSWGDGGAERTEAQFKAWFDGYLFAKTGKTTTYHEIVQAAERELDPEYAEFVRLAKKFENK